MRRLANKVCIVTGCGSGIGKAIAERFALEGALTVCSSRRSSNGQPVSDRISGQGGQSIFVRCDVSCPEEVQALFNETVTRYGRVDVLVNNAGVNYCKPFEESSVEDWDHVMNTDLRGTYLCSHRGIREMLRTGGGSIINIASVHTRQCMAGAAPYDAAKWAIIGLTKSLAVEFALRGIRVNALSPGLIDTPIWEDIQNAAPDIAQCHAYWKANIPMGRVGTVDEVAGAAVFLAADESSYLCGANILVDGGMSSQLVSTPPFASEELKGRKREDAGVEEE